MVATPGNSLNITAAGLVKFDGTSAFSGVTTTQHDLLIGAASNGITSVAPSATSGVPVISQGASADPTFGTAVVAGGGTGLTSATAYAVLCGGTTSTGNFQSIASVGTSGQVLTSNGASALPTFQTGPAGAGSLILIQTQNASNSASLTFTTGITSTYNNYVLYVSGYQPATNATFLELQWSTDGGSTYVATGYQSGINNDSYNTSTWANNQSATTYNMIIFNAQSSGTVSKGVFNLLDVTSGANAIVLGMGTNSGAGIMNYQLMQGYNSTATINAFKILSSSGNMTAGQFSLYGVSK